MFKITQSAPITLAILFVMASLGLGIQSAPTKGSHVVPITGPPKAYKDGRPAAAYRLDAIDSGRVLLHGDGPGQCDYLGAREAIVFEWKGTYYLHYDGAGLKGWLACLATSKDLTHWTKHGPILDFGPKGKLDSASASSPWVYYDGSRWRTLRSITRMPTRLGGSSPIISV